MLIGREVCVALSGGELREQERELAEMRIASSQIASIVLCLRKVPRSLSCGVMLLLFGLVCLEFPPKRFQRSCLRVIVRLLSVLSALSRYYRQCQCLTPTTSTAQRSMFAALTCPVPAAGSVGRGVARHPMEVCGLRSICLSLAYMVYEWMCDVGFWGLRVAT